MPDATYQFTLDSDFEGNFGTRALSRTSLSVVTSNALEVRRDKKHIGLAKHQLGEIAANSVFVSLVGAMISRADELAVQTAAKLENYILDMLITTLEADSDHQPGVQREHLFRIKKFIASHLKDPQLSPQKITAALGVSKRHLHLMFEEEEATLARYILEQRLEACYQCIANPHYQTVTVSEIAFEHGFNDAAHFSRSFKKRFSISPSKARH